MSADIASTASIRPLTLLIATMEGSFTTMPLPRAYTQVFAVPRSIARSLENRENRERKLKIDYLYTTPEKPSVKLPKGETRRQARREPQSRAAFLPDRTLL